jgi:hypothetical protein
VNNFRKTAEHKSNTPTQVWMRSKTKLIFNTYLVREAPMELNISDKLLAEMGTKLQKCETSKSWPSDFFEPVYKEMWHFVLYNLWVGFVDAGELAMALEKADAASRRVSKRQGSKIGGGSKNNSRNDDDEEGAVVMSGS